MATGALSPERAVSPPPARSSSSPTLELDSGDEAGVLSDDASPGGHARYSEMIQQAASNSPDLTLYSFAEHFSPGNAVGSPCHEPFHVQGQSKGDQERHAIEEPSQGG